MSNDLNRLIQSLSDRDDHGSIDFSDVEEALGLVSTPKQTLPGKDYTQAEFMDKLQASQVLKAAPEMARHVFDTYKGKMDTLADVDAAIANAEFKIRQEFRTLSQAGWTPEEALAQIRADAVVYLEEAAEDAKWAAEVAQEERLEEIAVEADEAVENYIKANRDGDPQRVEFVLQTALGMVNTGQFKSTADAIAAAERGVDESARVIAAPVTPDKDFLGLAPAEIQIMLGEEFTVEAANPEMDLNYVMTGEHTASEHDLAMAVWTAQEEAVQRESLQAGTVMPKTAADWDEVIEANIEDVRDILGDVKVK